MSIPFIIGPDNVEPSKKFGFAVKSHGHARST